MNIDSNGVTEAEAKNVLSKNNQICSVELQSATRELVKFAAQNLPELKCLTLTKYQGGVSDDEIHFKNVYNYSVVIGSNNKVTPENIIFTNLRVFQTDALPSKNLWWIDFIGENENLTTLVQHSVTLNNQAFLELSEALLNLNLEEVSVVLAADVDAQNVVQFVEDNIELKKLNIKAYKNNEPIAKALRKEFGNKWTLTQSTFEINLEKNEEALDDHKTE